MKKIRYITLVLGFLIPATVHAETREEWITLGARIHGAFGPFIPVGLRIGLDAASRHKAEPRGLTITYFAHASPMA